MITQTDLINATEEFFSFYWNPKNGLYPSWSNEYWTFSNSIPNNNLRGCYALFNKENEVIYIGVGIGRSFGSYEGSGLGDRLKRYWKLNKEGSDKKYQPTDDWKDVTSILTIGFGEKHYHLAAALEIFLIRELTPQRNSQHKINTPLSKEQ